MKKLLILILFFGNLLAAIAQDALNRTWFLTELTIGGENISIPNEENQIGYPTLSILIGDAEGAVEGIGICNGFSSDGVAVTETLITFSISHTLIFCDTSEENTFEAAYFNFLGASDSQEFTYTVVEDPFLDNLNLTLTKSNGDIAIYSAVNENPPSALTQEAWYLDHFEINGISQNPPAQQQGQLNNFIISSFGENNLLQQQYLCFYGGSGTFSPFTYFGSETISIDFLAQLAMDCSVSILNEYDQVFTTQLEGKTHTYEILEDGEGRELILTDQNGDRIFYTNAFLHADDFDFALDLKISPNPAQNFITVLGERASRISTYNIVDVQGKVLHQNHFETTIDINTLPKGLYFLILVQGENRIIKRFIKN